MQLFDTCLSRLSFHVYQMNSGTIYKNGEEMDVKSAQSYTSYSYKALPFPPAKLWAMNVTELWLSHILVLHNRTVEGNYHQVFLNIMILFAHTVRTIAIIPGKRSVSSGQHYILHVLIIGKLLFRHGTVSSRRSREELVHHTAWKRWRQHTWQGTNFSI